MEEKSASSRYHAQGIPVIGNNAYPELLRRHDARNRSEGEGRQFGRSGRARVEPELTLGGYCERRADQEAGYRGCQRGAIVGGKTPQPGPEGELALIGAGRGRRGVPEKDKIRKRNRRTRGGTRGELVTEYIAGSDSRSSIAIASPHVDDRTACRL